MTTIEQAKDRLALAKFIQNDLFCGLSLYFCGEHVVVDDGQDRWVTDNFDESVDSVISAALEGCYDKIAFQDGRKEAAYQAYIDLCSTANCIYSKLGFGDVGDLVDNGCNAEVFELVGVEQDIQIEVCTNKEWLKCYGPFDFDTDDECDEWFDETVRKLEDAGYDAIPAQGGRDTCSGWHGCKLFTHKSHGLGTFAKISVETWGKIVDSII